MNTKEIITVKEVWKPGHRFCDFISSFSLHLMNSLRSYIKHEEECFISYPYTPKWVKKTRLRLVFQPTSRCWIS